MLASLLGTWISTVTVTIKKKTTNDLALEDVGLGDDVPDEIVLKDFFPKVTPYALGSRVQLIAQTGPWRYLVKTGDVGEVVKLAKSHSAEGVYAADDLYFVRMDVLIGGPKEVAYLLHKEIALVE